jgi:hypothetical protein
VDLIGNWKRIGLTSALCKFREGFFPAESERDVRYALRLKLLTCGEIFRHRALERKSQSTRQSGDDGGVEDLSSVR